MNNLVKNLMSKVFDGWDSKEGGMTDSEKYQKWKYEKGRKSVLFAHKHIKKKFDLECGLYVEGEQVVLDRDDAEVLRSVLKEKFTNHAKILKKLDNFLPQNDNQNV